MYWLSYIYLGYMFISLYFLSLYFILYLKSRKKLFYYPIPRSNPSVSLIVPAYNEQETIKQSIEAIFSMDYENILEVIVVNDCSKDKTGEILDDLKKKYKKLIVIHNKKNLGNAARSQNVGLKIARGDIIGVIDADSYPAKQSVRKMIGFFNDPKVGAVTCAILARNKQKFFEKLQAMEYAVIALTRKLLESVDAIYVTPGPLALYRREALLGIGGFDEENMTQDIEATWHITVDGWKRKMCLDTTVTSTVPSRFWPWFKQRQRWNIGGLQTIAKYKNQFMKKGMVGYFILPFFVASTFLGVVGLSVFAYLIITRLLNQYLLWKFSFLADTAVITLNSLHFTPSVLNYLGVVLFLAGAFFTIMVLSIMRQEILKEQNIFSILLYLTIYLAVYPFIMFTAIYRYIKRDYGWR